MSRYSESGKFVLRTGPELHFKLKEQARQSGESLNALCIRLIQDGLKASRANCYDDVIAKLRREFAGNLVGILLFGSQARGDAHESSDSDIMVVLEENVAIKRGLYRDWQNEEDRRISIHFTHLPSSTENPGSLWLECALDGIIMYDSDGRIGRTLRRLKDLISSGHVVRKNTHGQGFWVYT